MRHMGEVEPRGLTEEGAKPLAGSAKSHKEELKDAIVVVCNPDLPDTLYAAGHKGRRAGAPALVALAVVLALALSACSGMMKALPESEETPEPEANIAGTWIAERKEDGWSPCCEEDVEYQISEKRTVTFTKSQFIQDTIFYDRNTMEVLDDYHDQGKYTLNADGTITKIWLQDHDDDDETPRLRREVVKQYTLLEDELYLEDWFHDRPGASFDYHKRAAMLDFEGTWIGDHEYEDDGVIYVSTLTLTLAGDSFTYSEIELTDGTEDRNFQINGTFEFDSEELFLSVTVAGATLNGDLLDTIDPWVPGTKLRFGVGPTDQPERIRLSRFYNEQQFNPAIGVWSDRPESPSGDYWQQMTKQ